MRFLTTSVPATGNTMGRCCWCCWSGSAQTWAALSVKVQPAADNTSPDLTNTISSSAAAGTQTPLTALAPVKHRTVLTGAFKCQIIMSTEATLRGIRTYMALRHSPTLLSMQLSELYRSFSHLPTFHISIILQTLYTHHHRQLPIYNLLPSQHF